MKDAVTLREIDELLHGNDVGKQFVVPLKRALGHFSRITVPDSVKIRVLNGAFFKKEDILDASIKEEKRFLIVDEKENVIAIADIDIEEWHIDYCNIIKYKN